MLSVPAEKSPLWSAVICGKRPVKFEHLAVQVFLARAKMQMALKGTDDTLNELVHQLWALFSENRAHPKIQHDLGQLQA